MTTRDARLDSHLTERLRQHPSTRGSARAPLAGEQQGWSDTELVPLLDAAERLAAVSAAVPPAAFSRDLEQRLLARAEHIRRSSQAGVVALPTRRANTTRSVRWGAAAAALLLVGVGTLTAAASAAPGSPLSGLGHVEEGVRLQVAPSGGDRVRLHLEYAERAVQTIHGGAHGSSLRAATEQLQNELKAAQADLATLPPGGTRDNLASQIAGARSRATQALTQALPALVWSDRLVATTALGALGTSVPQLDQAKVTALPQASGTTTDGTKAIEIEITGSGIEPGAVLYLNGVATTITLTPSANGAVADEESLAPQEITSVGISNPDGTAATTTTIVSVGNGAGTQGHGSGSDGQGAHGTPDDSGNSPNSTPHASGSGQGHGPSATSTPRATATPHPKPSATPK